MIHKTIKFNALVKKIEANKIELIDEESLVFVIEDNQISFIHLTEGTPVTIEIRTILRYVQNRQDKQKMSWVVEIYEYLPEGVLIKSYVEEEQKWYHLTYRHVRGHISSENLYIINPDTFKKKTLIEITLTT